MSIRFAPFRDVANFVETNHLMNVPKKYLPVEQLEVFKRFEVVADWTGETVSHWSVLAQKTIGEQFARAIDSVGANLAEGDGRGSDRDALKFFYYARGSAWEAQVWLKRAIKRKLVDEKQGEQMLHECELGCQQLNSLIQYRLKAKVKEDMAAYEAPSE